MTDQPIPQPRPRIRMLRPFVSDQGVRIDHLVATWGGRERPDAIEPDRFIGHGQVQLRPDQPPIQIEFPIEATCITEAFDRYREFLDRAGQELVRRMQAEHNRIVVANQVPR